MKFWEWLSGKKRAIGVILFFLATAVIPLVITEFGFNPSWMSGLTTILLWAANICGVTGVVHAMVKK